MIKQENRPVHTGLGNRQSHCVSAPSALPFESVVDTLKFQCLAFSVILPLRGVCIGVIYTRNIQKWSVPTTDSNGRADGAITEQLWR